VSSRSPSAEEEPSANGPGPLARHESEADVCMILKALRILQAIFEYIAPQNEFSFCRRFDPFLPSVRCKVGKRRLVREDDV